MDHYPSSDLPSNGTYGMPSRHAEQQDPEPILVPLGMVYDGGFTEADVTAEAATFTNQMYEPRASDSRNVVSDDTSPSDEAVGPDDETDIASDRTGDIPLADSIENTHGDTQQQPSLHGIGRIAVDRGDNEAAGGEDVDRQPEAADPERKNVLKGLVRAWEKLGRKQETKAAADSPSPRDRVLASVPTETTMSERHPGWPKLDAHFYNNAHDGAVDFADVPAHLSRANVYLCEGATPQVVEVLQRIADDPQKPLEDIVEKDVVYGEPVKGSFWEPIVRGLYASGVSVDTIEVAGDDWAVLSKVEEIVRRPRQSDVSYDEALDNLAHRTVEYVDAQADREIVIVRNFEAKIGEILDRRPELRSLPGLNVLVSLGGEHTTVAEAVSSQGVDTTSHGGIGDTYTDRLKQEVARGKTPSRELLERANAEDIVIISLANRQKQTTNTDMRGLLMATVGAMDSTDMRRLHEVRRQTGSSPAAVADFLEHKDLSKVIHLLDEFQRLLGSQRR